MIRIGTLIAVAVLLFGGCARQIPFHGITFSDQGGRNIPLRISSTAPIARDGRLKLTGNEPIEVHFKNPLPVALGNNVLWLQFMAAEPNLIVEFIHQTGTYRIDLPRFLNPVGTFSVEIPPETYKGFRLASIKPESNQKVSLSGMQIGAFPLEAEIEGLNLVSASSAIYPINKKGSQAAFQLPQQEKESPSLGILVKLQYHGPFPYPTLRVVFSSETQNRNLTLRVRPKPEEVVVYYSWLGFVPNIMTIEGLREGLSIQIAEYAPDPAVFSPLIADVETILTYPMEAWRNTDFEVFRWSLYPEILIFDTRNYTVQKWFFHRLAFFVEKKGFRGRLSKYEEIWDLHGWNAHNYRGEGLSAFFNEANRIGFPLNEKERWLAEYLQYYGIIHKRNGIYYPGVGGVLSISREARPAHRRLLLTHEAFHGLYYMMPSFRDIVASLWEGQSDEERNFWFYFLDWREYDITDLYLVVNEFQAFLLQQPLGAVQQYFKERIFNRIVRENPAMEPVLRSLFERFPDMFIHPARVLNDFLAREAGITPATVSAIIP